MKRFLLLIVLVVILVAGFIVVIGVPDPSTPELAAPSQGEYITIKENNIRYFRTGTGPDILLIHGQAGIAEDWETLVPLLSRNFRVTVFDRPGHGWSSMKKTESPLQYNVETVVELIDKLALTDPVVMGHSYGGSVALGVALKDPAKVKGYVFLSPCAYQTPAKTNLMYQVANTPVVGTGLVRFIKEFVVPPMIQSAIVPAFSPNSDLMPADYYNARIDILKQTKTVVAIAREELTENNDIKGIETSYKNIKKPVLIIHGDTDKIVPVSSSIKLKGEIPGAELVMLFNTGHMVQYARAKEIDEAIVNYFIRGEGTTKPKETIDIF